MFCLYHFLIFYYNQMIVFVYWLKYCQILKLKLKPTTCLYPEDGITIHWFQDRTPNSTFPGVHILHPLHLPDPLVLWFSQQVCEFPPFINKGFPSSSLFLCPSGLPWHTSYIIIFLLICFLSFLFSSNRADHPLLAETPQKALPATLT